jgi:hypothetical protein
MKSNTNVPENKMYKTEVNSVWYSFPREYLLLTVRESLQRLCRALGTKHLSGGESATECTGQEYKENQ